MCVFFANEFIYHSNVFIYSYGFPLSKYLLLVPKKITQGRTLLCYANRCEICLFIWLIGVLLVYYVLFIPYSSTSQLLVLIASGKGYRKKQKFKEPLTFEFWNLSPKRYFSAISKVFWRIHDLPMLVFPGTQVHLKK